MQTTAHITDRETWQLDPAHTLVEFSVKHMMIATVKGRFGAATGTVLVNPADPTTATVDVVIEAASIYTGINARDAHLRSADFFDVDHHPTITYHADRVERRSETELVLHGDLTIRGVTRPVPLLVESAGMATDPDGILRAGFSATAKINRRDFGLTWNVALETGGVLVGDEVKIAIEAELVRAEEQGAAGEEATATPRAA